MQKSEWPAVLSVIWSSHVLSGLAYSSLVLYGGVLPGLVRSVLSWVSHISFHEYISWKGLLRPNQMSKQLVWSGSKGYFTRARSTIICLYTRLFRKGEEQTTGWVILEQALSWPVNRQPFAIQNALVNGQQWHLSLESEIEIFYWFSYRIHINWRTSLPNTNKHKYSNIPISELED